jgi:hypothetical protein
MPNLERANRAADEQVQTILQSVLGNSQAYASNTKLIDLIKKARDKARTGRIYAENALRETQLFRQEFLKDSTQVRSPSQDQENI